LGGLALSSHSGAYASPVPEADRFYTFSTGAGRPRKIAVGPRDQIYVAADRQVLVFDALGRQLSTIKLPRPARCLAVDAEGFLTVGLINQIRRIDASGKEIAVWSHFSDKSILSGIALSQESVFVADAGQQCIWRLDGSGKVLGQIEGKNGFASPAEFFAVGSGSDGLVRVANSARHRIESYQADGTFLGAWGQSSRTIEGFSGCCNPVSFVQLANGNFFTAERGRPRVKLYDSNGRFQKLLAGPEQFAKNAAASVKDNTEGCTTGGLDVAVDSTGAAIVLDRVTGIVHRIPV
jgi:sugar lactone lactonase YvrE